jgi:thioredoxin reductase (NADPH)
MEKIKTKVVILGSGPAGYSAAIYAARANLNPVLVSGMTPGGQLQNTTDVDNWPGGTEGLQGPDLMKTMLDHVSRLDVRVINDHITSAELSKRPFVLNGYEVEIEADSVIIATGATARYLGLDSEKAYMGKGVSACATCDGFFFRNQKVAVVGGGNTAVEEALYLSNLADHVTLIHRRDELRAEKMLSEKLFQKAKDNKNITIEWNQTLEDIQGDGDLVKSIKLKNTKDNTTKTLDMDGVFIAIGHDPNTGIFSNQVKMDENGYITLAHNTKGKSMITQTSVAGVFAAGDVSDPVYRQAITSAGSGCMAALDAEKYLDTL